MTEKSSKSSSERFNRVLKDPRFRRAARKETKIKVDDRFKGIFSDPKFTRPYNVDKYGRKLDVKNLGSKKEMEKFYRLESDGEGEVDSSALSDKGIETDASIEDDYSSESSDSENSSDDSSEEMVLEDAFAQHPLVNNNVTLGDASRRLAIVNVDWDQLKAVDLFVLVSAFKPPMGQVKSVKIYPSEFGKERIAKEAIEGPPREIFATSETKNNEVEEGYAESDSESDCDPLKDLKAAKTLVEESNNFDRSALRRYQLERLRYYYAVVDCDSIETASAIYHHCDGREFETSTNTLDLRYIPDDVSFNEEDLNDCATCMPKKYNAKPGMVTDALQRSNIKLTWDQDDPDRRRLTRVNHGKIDYEEADLRAYLASDSDSEAEAELKIDSKADKIARYRALLLSSADNTSNDVFGRRSHDDNDRLDITFTSALHEKSSDSELSEVEASEVSEVSGDEDERVAVFDSDGNLVTNVSDESSKAEDNKSMKKERRKFESKKPEKFVLEKEWKKKNSSSSSNSNSTTTTNKKMHKKQSDLLDDTESFNVNLDDDRFKAVYDSPAYAIDPTAPMFKKTKGMEAIIGERQRRRRDGDVEKDEKRRIRK